MTSQYISGLLYDRDLLVNQIKQKDRKWVIWSNADAYCTASEGTVGGLNHVHASSFQGEGSVQCSMLAHRGQLICPQRLAWI